MRFFTLAIVSVALTLILASGASAEKRHAFVVGVNDYSNLAPQAQLKRAVADATSVGAALRQMGYAVTQVTEGATHEQLLRRFGDFKRTIEAGDTVVLFYAGHGIAIGGTNYLLPADVPEPVGDDDRLVRNRSIAESDLIDDIRERGARVTVAIIDACRDNPFPKTGSRSVGASRGLAVKEPARGVLSIYSAGTGQRALDRLNDTTDVDPNSVFTRVLLQQIAKPGLNLIDLGETLRDEVSEMAQGVGQDQTPAVYNQIIGARRFSLAPATLNPEPRRDPADDAADRQAALTCDRIAGYQGDPELAEISVGTKPWDAIAPEAVPACERASRAFPDLKRYRAQLGRALGKNNQIDRALEIYRTLVDQNEPHGLTSLGRLTKDGGPSVQRDPKMARELLERAVALGFMPAFADLADMLYAKEYGQPDLPRSIDLNRRAAEGGVISAMTNLGFAYQHGEVVKQDDVQALGWYRRAMAAGSATATYNVGTLLKVGRGTTKDEAEALRLFRKAADAGFGKARTELGVAYRNGTLGLSQNLEEARNQLQKAYELGDSWGTSELAFTHLHGIGVAKDPDKAKTLFTRAAELGNSGAMDNLGYIAETGASGPVDRQLAIDWYTKAANAGSAFGRSKLQQMKAAN